MPGPADRVRNALPSGVALLGIGGCALCCFLPLFVPAGLVSGVTVAAINDWMPGIAAVLLAAAGLAWWWNSRRRSCSSCDGGRAGSCFCGAGT